VARTYFFRQFQHAREHRGHQLGVGDAPFRDQFQVFFRIEIFHDDDGAAGADRKIDRGLRRRVIEWRRREVDHAFAVLPDLVQEIEDRQVLHRRLLRQRPQDAFRPAGGAGGIKHRGADAFV
jgi:hypothetical protein